MSKNCLVIGLYHFGAKIAFALAEAGNHVTGMDYFQYIDQRLFEVLNEIINPETSYQRALTELGVEHFDVIFVALPLGCGSSGSTLLLFLKKMGTRYLVTTAWSEKQVQIYRWFGADEVVKPDTIQTSKFIKKWLHKIPVEDLIMQ
jgi:Trk K+ transport system NAD-binding subunit